MHFCFAERQVTHATGLRILATNGSRVYNQRAIHRCCRSCPRHALRRPVSAVHARTGRPAESANVHQTLASVSTATSLVSPSSSFPTVILSQTVCHACEPAIAATRAGHAAHTGASSHHRNQLPSTSAHRELHVSKYHVDQMLSGVQYAGRCIARCGSCGIFSL
jgi:hypothetical protein